MSRILSFIKKDKTIELERLRIWDFFLLFPNKMSEIKLKRTEEDIRKLIKNFIERKSNPYESIVNNKVMFEKIRPYQMTAIKCLASYGIINKDYTETNRIKVISDEKLNYLIAKTNELTVQEKNAVALLNAHFYDISMYGEDGLKNRTNLLESRYDA